MKIEIQRLTDSQLAGLQKRYLYSIPNKKEKVMLNRLSRELLRRKKLLESVKQELEKVSKEHPEYELICNEIKNRYRLNLLDKNTELYRETYHRWFAQRTRGLALKLYKWFIPVPKDELWMT